MKCDELKAYKVDVTIPVYGTIADAKVYLKKDVDEAIAELKAKLQNQQGSRKYNDWRCEMKCDKLMQVENPIEWGSYYDKDEADEAIAELKTALNESEEARYEAGADAADYYQENRRLKRALWIARAELCRRLDVDRYLRKHRNSWYNENCLTWADACVAMEVKMCNAESKCRAKAEEYK